MKPKEFKEITLDHVEMCKKIIKRKGKCSCFDCDCCPFYYENGEVNQCHAGDTDKKTMEMAEEFLEMDFKEE